MVKVQIPGIAFGALKESAFPDAHPELWRKVLNHSVSLARGRGITVHIELDESEWALVCEQLTTQYQELVGQKYAHRGLEGSIVMTSLMVAISRIDHSVRPQ